jgi:flagellar motor protein MotB
MTNVQQGSVTPEGKARRLRDSAGLLASGFVHALLLLVIFLFGSPRLLATTAPQSIVVDIVRPEELPKGALTEPAMAKQNDKQQQQQQTQQQQTQQQQTQQQQTQQQPAQQQQAQQQAGAQPQPSQQSAQPVRVASATPSAPVFTSLYPWPVARPDVQEGDYRTFESMEKSDRPELAQFKARLKECWRPPAVSGRKLSAALRVALRMDGSLAGAPELVEVSASPEAVALVTSAKQALAACGPFGFMPADSYDSWKSLSLTFSPEDIAVAAVTK